MNLHDPNSALPGKHITPRNQAEADALIKSEGGDSTPASQKTVTVRARRDCVIEYLPISAGQVVQISPQQWRALSRFFEIVPEPAK